MQSKARKKNYIILVLIVLFIIAISSLLYSFTNHPNEAYLKLIIKLEETEFPRKLDEITTVNQPYTEGIHLVYPYTIDTYTAEEFKKLADIDYLYNLNIKLNCTNAYDLLKQGYSIKHIYYGNDKEVILSMVVTENSCNNVK